MAVIGRNRGTLRTIGLGAVAVTVALLTSGCGFLVAGNAHPGQPGDPLIVTIPANGTQLTSVTSVPVLIDLPRVQPGTLSVALETGGDFGAPIDVTSRFTVAGRTATATLGANDFSPGLTRLVASGIPDGGGARISRDSVWSYEPGIDVSAADHCEFLGQSRCQLPFPSNWFTVADPSSRTGRRVHFGAQTWTPAAGNAPAIDPTEYNRNDGFSPGSAITLLVPGVDLAKTGAAPITDIAQSVAPNQPIVLLDATTGKRWPFFAELDANATSDATRTLIIRPARNFPSGHHIVVGLANLERADGTTIPARRSFEVYRDLVPTFIPQVEQRRAAMNETIHALEVAGMHRQDLFLAWDFTVASDENLTERSLHIRDDAFASLNGGAPAFTVNSVQDDVSPTIWRRVTGTYDVPLYLTGTGAPGSRFNYAPGAGKDALPVRNGTFKAQFICNIPRATSAAGSDPVAPGRAIVYGHGLLGNATEVNSFGAQANAFNSVMCATPWIGMSSEDVPNVAGILLNLNGFPTLADRLQQSFLNMQFLARVMKDPNGLVTNAAFRAGTPSKPVIKTGEAFFNGNSQGGILGGAVTALSKEWTRAVLGVPAMNYSTLLQRSVDWDEFSAVLKQSYPDEVDQLVGLSLIQMLWDRGENNGYATRMTTNPLPGSPPHQVLLIEAFGDHQVTNIGTETQARTMPGLRVWQPALAPGRSTDVTPMWDIPAISSVPFTGSVLVEWDYGTPAPPITNTPNRGGSDPHGAGAANVNVLEQVNQFLRTNGTFVDVCTAGPCQG